MFDLENSRGQTICLFADSSSARTTDGPGGKAKGRRLLRRRSTFENFRLPRRAGGDVPVRSGQQGPTAKFRLGARDFTANPKPNRQLAPLFEILDEGSNCPLTILLEQQRRLHHYQQDRSTRSKKGPRRPNHVLGHGQNHRRNCGDRFVAFMPIVGSRTDAARPSKEVHRKITKNTSAVRPPKTRVMGPGGPPFGIQTSHPLSLKKRRLYASGLELAFG